MALKAIIETRTEIPEGLTDFYEEREGQFHLAVEGMTEKTKLDEFRNSNIDLKKQVETMGKSLDLFAGVDPIKAKDAISKMSGFEDKELMDQGQFDELFKKKELELTGKIDAVQSHATEQETLASRYKDELETYRVTSAIQTAVNEAGTPQSSAIADILARAKTSWSIDEKGNLFCIDETGKARYSENGTQYMSPREWATELIQSAPHLFASSSGGGANGSGQATRSDNPWAKGSVNLTKQGQLVKDNPILAKQLASEQGISLSI
jgi:hypothetical protein